MPGAKLESTRWPGIYRRGDRWAYEWTDATGKRRRGSADSREQASARKGDEEAKATRGELPVLGNRPIRKLAAPDLARLAANLAAREGDEYLADRTIRRIFAPVSAMLA